MKPLKAVPILFATDVRAGIAYFKEKLKFDTGWEWDDPPHFGGLSLGAIEFFFCKNDQGNPGTWVRCSSFNNCLYNSKHSNDKSSGRKPGEEFENGMTLFGLQ